MRFLLLLEQEQLVFIKDLIFLLWIILYSKTPLERASFWEVTPILWSFDIEIMAICLIE